MFHRGFLVVSIAKIEISMFTEYHRGFWVVLPKCFLHFACADAFRRGNRLRSESLPLRIFPWKCPDRAFMEERKGFGGVSMDSSQLLEGFCCADPF